MKRSIVILIILFIAIKCWPQDSNPKLESQRVTTSTQTTHTISDLRSNSFYLEIGGKGILGSVNYDKILPVTDKSGIILGFSVGFLGDFAPEVNFLHGKSKNFLEAGIGYSFPEQLIIPQVGYRYQGDNGFLFRAGGMYFFSTASESFGDFPMAGLSFGYSY